MRSRGPLGPRAARVQCRVVGASVHQDPLHAARRGELRGPTQTPGVTVAGLTPVCHDGGILQRGFKCRVRPGSLASRVSDLSLVTQKAAETDRPLRSPG